MSRPKRQFTPEQKANIVNQIDTDRRCGMTFEAAVEKNNIAGSLYFKWKRKLEVGIKSSLRNGKPAVDVEKRQMMSDIKKLRSIVMSQSLAIAELKKEMNLEYLTI